MGHFFNLSFLQNHNVNKTSGKFHGKTVAAYIYIVMTRNVLENDMDWSKGRAEGIHHWRLKGPGILL